MLGHVYYNSTTRRYASLFGTLFNDIIITREDNDSNEQMKMKVPISYGPVQKFLARLNQDPNLDAPAMTLPRMSFEMLGMIYAGDRKLTRQQLNRTTTSDANSLRTQYTAAPYDLEFQLNIMTKYSEDANKIVEQIIPFFQPEWTASVRVIDELDPLDISIVLNGISVEDTYSGSFDERRALIWTLNFTMKAMYFGPVYSRKVIKFTDVDVFSDSNANDAIETIQTQPGLTANGEPTTDINQTIPYQDINLDDDWDTIVVVED